MMPFRLVLPNDDDFRLNLYVERREISRATGPSPSAFSMPRLRPIVTGCTACGKHQYGTPLRPWRYKSLRVSAMRASRFRIRVIMN
eukprot:6194101-Pleurochrysis_carterae.AAC.1